VTRYRALYVCRASGARIPVEVETNEGEQAAKAYAVDKLRRRLVPSRSVGGHVARYMPPRELERVSFEVVG
jgi:hypothetical protein